MLKSKPLTRNAGMLGPDLKHAFWNKEVIVGDGTVLQNNGITERTNRIMVTIILLSFFSLPLKH